MCWEEILSQILYNTQISVSLQVLNKAFTSRIVAVPAAGNRPVQIITPNKELRGYIILNPSQTTTSSSTNVTMFASALRTVGAPGPTYTSGAINVEGVGTARFFLYISAITGATTIEVELQTLDRLSGNWAAAQTGIFGGPFVPVLHKLSMPTSENLVLMHKHD